MSIATIRAARTVATPLSSEAWLGCRNRLSGNGDAGKHRRPTGDPGHDEVAVAAQFHSCPGRGDRPCGDEARAVATRSQPRRFACGVGASDVNDHGHECRGTEDENHHQTGDRQSGLDGTDAGIGG